MLSCLDAVNALKLPTGFSDIGLFGAIDERKGADRPIDAFSTAGLSAQWKLLLAGKFSATIRNRIHGQTADSNRIVALDKFIDTQNYRHILKRVILCAFRFGATSGPQVPLSGQPLQTGRFSAILTAGSEK